MLLYRGLFSAPTLRSKSGRKTITTAMLHEFIVRVLTSKLKSESLMLTFDYLAYRSLLSQKAGTFLDSRFARRLNLSFAAEKLKFNFILFTASEAKKMSMH
jgi:hypothetical protein